MTEQPVRAYAAATDSGAYLAAETRVGNGDRFAALEAAAAAVLARSFNGRAPIYARLHAEPVFTAAVPSAAVATFESVFDHAEQQRRGAWWLPEQTGVRFGPVNLPAYYRDHPAWAMTRCADDHGRFPLTNVAAFACWALLVPLADDLLEPLRLRGPDNGVFTADDTQARWAAVTDRYRNLQLDTPDVTAAVSVMTPGQGWSRLTAAQQVAAKQHFVDALAATLTPDTVRRWRTGPLADIARRYLAKAKRGPAESRAVLVKAVQPAVAAWFGGDWLALLDYLGVQAADGEVITTALPAARLYVEGSAKVQQVAQERGLGPEQVADMLSSYLGSDAVQSPIQRRVDVIRGWWAALDEAQARQRSGDDPLEMHWDTPAWSTRATAQSLRPARGAGWITDKLREDSTLLWGGELVAKASTRLVSTVSPSHAMRDAIGTALLFWFEVGQTCWFLCEGPYSRTDLAGMRSHYRRALIAMADAGTPVDPALFADLEAAESKLGPPEAMHDPGDPIDVSHGITVTFSLGAGTRRAGFAVLRDIVTRHRRAWAAANLDTALRANWEQPLRELSAHIHQHLAARGKLPTARQTAALAEQTTNAWFGGDLSATLAAIGERPVSEQTDARMLPADRLAYCRRVYAALGGQPDEDTNGTWDWTGQGLLHLAAGAPAVLQRQELLGQAPTPKEAKLDRQKWPDGLNFDRYMQVLVAALPETQRGTADTRTTPADASDDDQAGRATSSPTIVYRRPAPPDPHPPWEMPGLPCHLTPDDFIAARQIATTLTGTVTTAEHYLEPARGRWARYLRVAGTDYDHNQRRLRALAKLQPLTRTDEAWAVYAAILVPDPTPGDDTTQPIGICSELGYIGSVWSRLSTSWAKQVRQGVPRHRFVVTRLAVIKEHGTYDAVAWIPTLELAPWLQ